MFCSVFDSASAQACSASHGSPVICNDFGIQGIVLNDGTCERSGDQFKLKYHSMTNYVQWIDQVITSFFSQTNLRQFEVRVFEATKNLDTVATRCIGTVVSKNHVLTPASCVNFVSESQNVVAIEGRFDNGDNFPGFTKGLKGVFDFSNHLTSLKKFQRKQIMFLFILITNQAIQTFQMLQLFV